jgi:hypothetical protein
LLALGTLANLYLIIFLTYYMETKVNISITVSVEVDKSESTGFIKNFLNNFEAPVVVDKINVNPVYIAGSFAKMPTIGIGYPSSQGPNKFTGSSII